MPITTTQPLPTGILRPDVVREWLRLGATGDDLALTQLITAALDWAETECYQPLFVREYQVTDWYPLAKPLPLLGYNPRGIRFESSLDNVAFAADLTVPYLVGLDGVVSLSDRLTTGTYYRLYYTAGYEVEAVPNDLKLGLLKFIAENYDSRADSVSERITAAQRLIWRYRYETL